MNRHRAREVALQILYRYDVGTLEKKGTSPIVPVSAQLPKVSPAFSQELNQHFDHFKVAAELREFAAQLVVGTLAEIQTLDQLLEKHASNWKISRMASIDRSLLRMAAYELSHFPETPSSVVIDEAIELGRQFGTEDSPSFVNGVLDAIKASVRPEPT